MGTVYEAESVSTGRRCAIKFLGSGQGGGSRSSARFEREAQTLARLEHEHVIAVFDFGWFEDQTPFFVMEYVRGRTLRKALEQDGPLEPERAVALLKQACRGMAHAHAQGVVHRDLKSDNIMLLDTTNVGDHAKVLDFGIAKITEPEGKFDGDLTAPNLVIGTPQYMSPEQCSQDSEIDHRSDIYSLGVILFEMLVGHVPFGGDSATIVMMKHLQDPVPSVLEERPDVPPPIGRVVARAMAKVPGNRYQSVAELIEDLTIASGMIVPNAGAAVASTATTGQVAATPTHDDADEVTVVRPRQQVPSAEQ